MMLRARLWRGAPLRSWARASSTVAEGDPKWEDRALKLRRDIKLLGRALGDQLRSGTRP